MLFTSYQMMQKAADAAAALVRQQQGYPLLSQSDGLPRTQMVERFRDGGQRGAVRRR